MKQILFTIIFITPLLMSGQIITVKQDGTGDFTTIQQAINHAWNGDTVLVYPGTYYENVDFKGKSLTLGSLTLTTGDVNYKYSTIIDGNRTSSCILLKSYETDVVINGFTLQHGSGYRLYNNYNTYGGAIYMDHAHAMIYNCIVKNNKANTFNGGIGCDNYSSLFLSSVSIHDNQAYNTGGLSIGPDSEVTFDSVNRCSIYNNFSGYGCDIYIVKPDATVEIYLDTFTVAVPTPYFLTSIDFVGNKLHNYTYDFQHAFLEPVNADLYVNPVTGNDTNTGTSPDSALKTIAFAYSKIKVDSSKINTIHLADGIYSDSANGEKFPLYIRPYIYIVGETMENTILDGEYLNKIATAYNNTSNYGFRKLTIKRGGHVETTGYTVLDGAIRVYESNKNVVFDSILSVDNWMEGTGSIFTIRSSVNFTNSSFNHNRGGFGLAVGGSDANHDTCFITNCKFQDNYPDSTNHSYIIGGGLSNGGSSFVSVVTGCLFTDNVTGVLRGLITGDTSMKVWFTNCTFYGNAVSINNCPSIRTTDGKLTFYNCISFNEGEKPIYTDTQWVQDTIDLTVSHSLIEGGINSIYYYDKIKLIYDTTNIDTDPLFYGGEEFPYNLSAESPCIDAGTLDLPQFILDKMPATDLAGNPRIFNGKIDMGAYEWNPTVGTEEHQTRNAKRQTPNLKVSPNPFTGQTAITVLMQKTADIDISIYNINGLHVKTLMHGRQPAGTCTLFWNGTDENGTFVPAGVYIAVLKIDGKETESVKVIKE